jgi:hypothetical protein
MADEAGFSIAFVVVILVVILFIRLSIYSIIGNMAILFASSRVTRRKIPRSLANLPLFLWRVVYVTISTSKITMMATFLNMTH